MPALPAVPGVIRVTIPFKYGGDTSCLNRLYIHYAGTAPTPAQLQTFADSVSTAWGAQIKSLCTGDVVQNPIQCTDLSSSTGAVASGTTSNTGTRAGAGNPAGIACMIQFLIARRYRGGKPKVFLPAGVAPDILTPQTWTAAFLTAVTNQWATFIADILIAGWAAAGTLTHVNVSYYAGNTPVQNPITHRWRNVPTLRGAPVVDPVLGYSTETGIASQRRRNMV